MKRLTAIVLTLTFSLQTLPVSWAKEESAVSNSDKNTWMTSRFQEIESDARSERYTGGGVMLGLGVVSGVGAILASSSTTPTWRNEGTLVLGIVGGVFALSGILILALPTQFEGIPQRFQAMPQDTPEQLQTKVTAGEEYLAKLSEEAKSQRLLGGGTLIALGIAEGVWYFTKQNSYTGTDDSTLLYGSVLTAGLGIATLLFPRSVEKSHEQYQAWAGSRRLNSSVNFNLAPIPSGAMGTLTYRF